MSHAYLSAEVPPAGGLHKAVPEDFEVDELPAYLPSGEGEHLFLLVQKRARTTQEVAKALARQVGAGERDVSWAGLKDRQALTRQWLCLPAKFEPKVGGFSMEGVQVLEARRHGNKLKSGHLHGNRFRITLRDVGDVGAAQATMQVLTARGLPNFFGEQRFGRSSDNAQAGRRILEAGGRHRDRFERKLFLSAYQSELFNRVLEQRLRDGTMDRALEGDVLKKHPTGGEFLCAEVAVDGPRVAAFEVSPTGPLFGPQMRAPTGAAAALEARVLAEEGVTPALFENGGDETRGARRWLRVPLGQPTCAVEGRTVTLAFDLPSGSYATEVLREVMKGPDAG